MDGAIGVDAAFEIELLKSDSLRILVAEIGRENARLCWGLGYLVGQMNAFDRAKEILK